MKTKIHIALLLLVLVIGAIIIGTSDFRIVETQQITVQETILRFASGENFNILNYNTDDGLVTIESIDIHPKFWVATVGLSLAVALGIIYLLKEN